MPVASENVWRILYTVSRWLFPLLAAALVFLILLHILSESRNRREKIRSLPGSGTVGEMIVLSGSRELDVNTWFPVPREGVLGSVRSCDLVIPCPGVHTKHLDFSWEDGTGLRIRPRNGCEVKINGIPVTCRTRAEDGSLTHGDILQVGSALLRLHLFAALDNTASRAQQEFPACAAPPVFVPGSESSAGFSPGNPGEMSVAIRESMSAPVPEEIPEAGASPEAPHEYHRRSDRWKEDLGD